MPRTSCCCEQHDDISRRRRITSSFFAKCDAYRRTQLVDHSMGGAVTVRACPLLLEHKYPVSGVAVLDVVEGSAIEALHMYSLLNARPDGFEYIQDRDDPQLALRPHLRPLDYHPCARTRPPFIHMAHLAAFTGLSEAFLTIQGKLQTVVAAGVGHMLHEDDPAHVAEILLDLWRWNVRMRLPFTGVGECRGTWGGM
ncbi:hypothetical protein DFH09DRAFT_1309406 [Mycena vulgaris]|nr:hypothetical protein DFH09DRAFT_1331678 [Mycena vulgaris]KAJ6582453.1 hypothetical protein DFH09DRAFT_1309406 [Mycena vulgaris]